MGACSLFLSNLLWAAPPTTLPEDQNVLLRFVSWSLIIVLAVTLAWPFNVPAAALAYKVRRGAGPVDMDPEDFWWRAAFAALMLCGLSLATLVVLFLLTVQAGLPGGLVRLVVLTAYLPAGAWLAFWAFGMEDMLQGMGVFVLYVLLPGLPLLWVGRLVGLWAWLARSAPWLLTPS